MKALENYKKSNGHPAKQIRCAIYTRKSTNEGLEQEFNSLDAQREAAEAYISSHKIEDWVCLPDRYDDGGFTGGNIERPGLKKLIRDIEAGKIDCVTVYKVDRISRSLLDFSQLIEVFERHKVSFVSITQNFDTSSSMGRLILNILLSFAQFERELIAERTRDKMSAARRKGKWTGGIPVLGYDVADEGGRLVINEDEAHEVRAIFDLYLESQSLLATVKEINQRGWKTKDWTTRKGIKRHGKTFDKTKLHKMLTNPIDIGKITLKNEIFEGEHAAIVDPDQWAAVQKVLRRNGGNGGKDVRNKYGSLLKGLIVCVPCKKAMTHTFTAKNGNRRYRYYVCSRAQKEGWDVCPSKSVAAQDIEKFIIERIRNIGNDPDLLEQTLIESQNQIGVQIDELKSNQAIIKANLNKYNAEILELIEKVSFDSENDSTATSRMADLQDLIRADEHRLQENLAAIGVLNNAQINKEELSAALSVFDPVWDSLSMREQIRIVQLLVERIGYDGVNSKVAITFRPAGIKTLAKEFGTNGNERIEVNIRVDSF